MARPACARGLWRRRAAARPGTPLRGGCATARSGTPLRRHRRGLRPMWKCGRMRRTCERAVNEH
eukprot:scaffold115610_cov21-Phaeocystis_antarctica.AAC.1